MAEHNTITLDPRSGSIIRDRIDSGEYESAEEVVRAGLSLLDERSRKIAALRAAIIEGEESGPSEPFDFDEFLTGMRQNSPTSR